jgi:hypothetical protein
MSWLRELRTSRAISGVKYELEANASGAWCNPEDGDRAGLRNVGYELNCGIAGRPGGILVHLFAVKASDII